MNMNMAWALLYSDVDRSAYVKLNVTFELLAVNFYYAELAHLSTATTADIAYAVDFYVQICYLFLFACTLVQFS